MDYKGNLKGDALKHFRKRRRKGRGRKLSRKAAERGRKTSRDNKILKKRNDELQERIWESLRQREAEEARANAEASKRMRMAAAERERQRIANDPKLVEKMRIQREADARFQRERALMEVNKAGNKIKVSSKTPGYESKKVGKAGTVTIKAHVRKLANGTVINVRSFLRRIVKKISK